MPANRLIQNLPGSATLRETRRACVAHQDEKRSQIVSIEKGRATIEGTKQNVNVVRHKDMRGRQEDILRDLRFIDMSTVEGNTTTTILTGQGFEIIIDEVEMFIGNVSTTVRVMGKQAEGAIPD